MSIRSRHACRPILMSLVAVLLSGCTRPGPPAGETAGAETAAADTAAPANDPRWLDAPYVVMLSLDGFRADYLRRYPTPALQRLAAEGARASSMIPVFPSKTFPAHYTIATGMYAEHHGLVGNRFWDPARGETYSTADRDQVEDGTWYRGEPIWVTAEKQGMLSASFYFVGSEADVEGVRPTYWRRYDESVPDAERVDGVLDWLALPPAMRPHMITLYFSDLDDAGHRFGPTSPQVKEAVGRVDTQLVRLLDGIDALPFHDRVYVVVVSDHGMLGAPASRAQPVDLSLFPGVRMLGNGPYASVVVDQGGPERIEAVRDSLAAMLPRADVWLRQDVPERLHYSSDPRIGDIVILARPGSLVVPSDDIPTETVYTHGWDNRDTRMGAIFLVRGPGIAPGQRIAAFESVNVYPFLAHVLGLEPNPDIDGSFDVLAPILSEGY